MPLGTVSEEAELIGTYGRGDRETPRDVPFKTSPTLPSQTPVQPKTLEDMIRQN